jgi:hypothetical protein
MTVIHYWFLRLHATNQAFILRNLQLQIQVFLYFYSLPYESIFFIHFPLHLEKMHLEKNEKTAPEISPMPKNIFSLLLNNWTAYFCDKLQRILRFVRAHMVNIKHRTMKAISVFIHPFTQRNSNVSLIASSVEND